MIIEKLRSEHQEMINQMKNEHEKKTNYNNNN
jgi:hypothetical protein